MTQEEIDALLGTGSSPEPPSAVSEKKIDVQTAQFEEFPKPTGISEKRDHKIDMLIDLSLPCINRIGVKLKWSLRIFLNWKEDQLLNLIRWLVNLSIF